MASAMNPQKQLLSLIRDFATEKSQGERRVVGLKKQIEELRSEVDAANEELEQAKLCRDLIEQEIKGYEVELSMNDFSIHSLETRISLIQDEVSAVGSDLEALKNEEGGARDDFIDKMYEFNTVIRNLQQTVESTFKKEDCIGISSGDTIVSEKVTETDSRNLQDELAAQTALMENELAEEQSIHDQAQQVFISLNRKVSLMAAIVKETKELQDLTKLTSELEVKCGSLGEELQRRSICPSCNLNNVETFGGVLQENEEN